MTWRVATELPRDPAAASAEKSVPVGYKIRAVEESL